MFFLLCTCLFYFNKINLYDSNVILSLFLFPFTFLSYTVWGIINTARTFNRLSYISRGGRLNTARSMVSMPIVKTNERVFLTYGTLIRTSTSHQLITELLNHGLTEQYVMDRAKTNWKTPAFITYKTKAAWLRTLMAGHTYVPT
jgi:hypothetical protein